MDRSEMVGRSPDQDPAASFTEYTSGCSGAMRS
jgi:hypothetical protein